MISTSSPTLMMPRSMRPVATVPRPLIENTSSIAIRNGLSMSRTGSGMYAVERVEQLADRLLPLRVAVERREAPRPRTTGALSPSNLYLLRSSRTSISTRSSISGSSTASHLFRNTTMCVETDLAREQHVLARLRHDAVERAHHQDRAVHLRRARDHVLDVVGVAGAIDVRVVALRRLVLHVRRPRSSPSSSRRGPCRPWRCPRS